MSEKNILNRVVSKLNALPDSVRGKAVTMLIGRTVRYAGTSNIYIEKLTTTESVMHLKNKKKVQNHIGSIHAAAMALLAESATGLLVGMNVPDSCNPVIKSLHVDYLKRCQGDIKAVARLTDAQIEQITTTEKGDVTVEVVVTDERGVEPIRCEMIWAWTPKVRK